jgi:hypothetical protein
VRRVGLAEQYEDCFNAGGDGLFEVVFIGDIEVDINVNVHTMGPQCGVAVCI